MDPGTGARRHRRFRAADGGGPAVRRVDEQLGRLGHNPPASGIARAAVFDPRFPRRRVRLSCGVQLAHALTPPRMTREPAIRVTAMPADTNPYGGVFGGWLMGQ